jgi:hypothetical protein
VHRRMFSSIHSLYSLNASGGPQADNQKCLQTLPGVSSGRSENQYLIIPKKCLISLAET